MTSPIHMLGFAGSLRKNSYNRAGLKIAQQLVPEGATLEIVTLDEIPLYNQDYENDEPAPVRFFKEKIHHADSLLVVTPEYNYSIPGVLKNAIDWASRPTGKSVLEGKPEAHVMTAWEKFDDDGNLTDDKTREQIQALVEALVHWTKRFTS